MYGLLIQNFSRYITLTEEEKALLPEFFQYKKVLRKRFLLTEDMICKADYFVIKGCLRQYQTNADDRDHVVQFALEDWWISDLNSMLNGTPSVYNIDALEDSEVLVLELSRREQLFTAIPSMNIYWRKLLEKAFIALQQRLLFLQKPAEERYQAFLKKYGYFEQRIPQHQIAAYLGITRESLSRIRQTALKKV